MASSDNITKIDADLDVCRRLVFHPEEMTLIRVINAPATKPETLAMLLDVRGHVLTEVHGAVDTAISPERTLEGLIEDIDLRGHAHLIDELELVFRAPDPQNPTPRQEAKQQKSGLWEPSQLVTELTDQILLAHLQPKRAGLSKRPIRELHGVPPRSCFYFHHEFWKLQSLGALHKIPPRSLQELDLTDNSLSDVGAELSRFENLVELTLDGNKIKEVRTTSRSSRMQHTHAPSRHALLSSSHSLPLSLSTRRSNCTGCATYASSPSPSTSSPSYPN